MSESAKPVAVYGADPGVTGAIAFLPIDDPTQVEIVDFPTYKPRIGGTSIVSVDLLHSLNEASSWLNVVEGLIEYVSPRPNDGKKQVLVSGMNLGRLEACVSLSGLPVDFVTPMKWKNKMLGKTRDKKDSLAMARRLFPVAGEKYLTRVKDHNRAEALLLAEYVRRLRVGN